MQNIWHVFKKIGNKKTGHKAGLSFLLYYLRKTREYLAIVYKCLINSNGLVFGMRIAFNSIIMPVQFNTKYRKRKIVFNLFNLF